MTVPNDIAFRNLRKRIDQAETQPDVSDAYSVDGFQVIGSRRTGWTVATGTADRTTFDTAAVSTEELAQRVKALIDDLIAHGLIGT